MYRTVDVALWDDVWFQGLTPEAKLLFIYLWTNHRITAAGIYQLRAETMAHETGIEVTRVRDLLVQLEGDECHVCTWRDHWVFVRAFYKRQRASSNPDNFRKAALKALEAAPDHIKEWVGDVYPDLKPSHPHPIPIPSPSLGDKETVTVTVDSSPTERGADADAPPPIPIPSKPKRTRAKTPGPGRDWLDRHPVYLALIGHFGRAGPGEEGKYGMVVSRIVAKAAGEGLTPEQAAEEIPERITRWPTVMGEKTTMGLVGFGDNFTRLRLNGRNDERSEADRLNRLRSEEKQRRAAEILSGTSIPPPAV